MFINADLINRHIPEALTGNHPIQVLRAQTLLVTAFLFTSLCVVIGPLNYIIWDLPYSALIYGAGAVVFPTCVLVLKRTNNFALASHLLCAAASLIISGDGYISGGFFNPMGGWYIIPPVVASFLLGSRAALIWVVISIGPYVISYFTRPALVDAALLAADLPTADQYLIAHVVFVVTAAYLVNISLRAQEKTYRHLIIAEEQSLIASKAKSDFLAAVTHEMRTPLFGISAHAELLHRQTTDQAVLSRTSQIQIASQDLLRHVDAILTAAGGTQTIPSQRSFSVAHLLDQTEELYRPLGRERGLTLRVDKKCPDVDWVMGDATTIERLFALLIGNALKFTTRGTVTLGAHLNADNQDTITFFVKDTGHGIPKDQLIDIFEPFWQTDTGIRRDIGGIGLGLSHAQQLAGILDTTITATSTVGVGSLFSFNVMLKPAPNPPPAVQAVPTNGVAEHAKILLVDDMMENREVTRDLLAVSGRSVVMVSSGPEAIEAALIHSYTVILMDLHMPGMDGVQTTKLIRTNEQTNDTPATTIIGLTADTRHDQKTACLEAGMDDLLTKPYKLSGLQQLLRQYNA